ncbi:putative amidoligase domain-containing protein [Paenibacillus puldeungensis]
MKIRTGAGPMKMRLKRALERLGGPYRPLQESASSLKITAQTKETKVRKSTDSWLYYGTEQPSYGTSVREVTIHCLPAGAETPFKFTRDVRKRLEAAGLPTSDRVRAAKGNAALIRRYAVKVFHLRAIEAKPLGSVGQVLPLQGAEPDRDSLLWRRLEQVAVRALYAMNLDLGEVIVSAGEEGKYVIDKVSPLTEDTNERTIELYAREIKESLLELERSSISTSDVLIGMDPEFLLFDRRSGKVIPASRYLQRRGEAGCDVLRYRGRRMFPLAELRPLPGREPREVLTHLLRAFRIASESISDRELIWQAGAMPQRGFPLGGHLHFSGVPLTAGLLRTLDSYLALPLSLLEDGRSSRRRPRYGFLGDFRRQDYGDYSGFEYRTLPSFLVSPLATKGVVALARLILEDADQLEARPLEKDEMFFAFYKNQQEPLRSVLPQLISNITASAHYSQYESYIEPFLKAVSSGRTWDESTDIRRLWKMQNPS